VQYRHDYTWYRSLWAPPAIFGLRSSCLPGRLRADDDAPTCRAASERGGRAGAPAGRHLLSSSLGCKNKNQLIPSKSKISANPSFKQIVADS
jgi:hypothetical protein